MVCVLYAYFSRQCTTSLLQIFQPSELKNCTTDLAQTLVVALTIPDCAAPLCEAPKFWNFTVRFPCLHHFYVCKYANMIPFLHEIYVKMNMKLQRSFGHEPCHRLTTAAPTRPTPPRDVLPPSYRPGTGVGGPRARRVAAAGRRAAKGTAYVKRVCERLSDPTLCTHDAGPHAGATGRFVCRGGCKSQRAPPAHTYTFQFHTD